MLIVFSKIISIYYLKLHLKKEITNKTSSIHKSDFDLHYILPNTKKKSFPIHSLISHWMNSYSKYVNNKYDRSGPVWDGRINKRLVDSEEYLQNLICYIHRNPLHHGISTNYTDYKYSSYSEIINYSSDIVSSEVVLDAFGGNANYLAAHQGFKGGYGSDEFEF